MHSRSELTEPLDGDDPSGRYCAAPAAKGDPEAMAGDTYCANCGSELPEGARFCPGCGAARGTALGPTVIEQPDETPAPAVEAPAPATSETVLDETGFDQTDSSAADAPSATREPDTVPGVAAPAQELDPEPRERGQPTSTPPPREDAADRTPGPAPASPQSPAPGGRRGSSPQSSAPGGPDNRHPKPAPLPARRGLGGSEMQRSLRGASAHRRGGRRWRCRWPAARWQRSSPRPSAW